MITRPLAALFLLLPQHALAQGITNDFHSWLDANGYASFDFARGDLDGGSFGGRLSPSDPVMVDPVIFVHGNGDRASVWDPSFDEFVSRGYTSAELYATTWGPASLALVANQYHSREHLEHTRAFIEAVLDYTGAEHVDIIGHSMGVTLARKAVRGGSGHDLLDGGAYDLGPALTNDVDAFVGIAGANQGLVNCYFAPTTPSCGTTNGLYPGYLWWGFGPFGVSDFLDDLNSSSGFEGARVYSIWSSADAVIGYGNLVYGVHTSRIPGQDGEVVPTLGHIGLRDLTATTQWALVQ